MISIEYKNVKNAEAICLRPNGETDGITGNLTPTTFALGFTMALNVGVQEITEDNLADVWQRVYVWDRIVGSLRTDGEGNSVFFTYNEVKSHIGLRVNAVDLTQTKFWRKVRDTVSELAKQS